MKFRNRSWTQKRKLVHYLEDVRGDSLTEDENADAAASWSLPVPWIC